VITLRRTLVALALPLLLVTGCGEDEPKVADASESPTAASEVDYPEVGLDLVDRPELAGVYERALQTYIDFERGRRLAARTGEVGKELSFNAIADVVDPYREALAAYAGGGTYDGDVVIEFLDARPRDSVLRLDICVDATALEVPDGAPTLLGEATRAPQLIEITNIVGPWRVTKAEPVDGSC
jgi:hypothetical protein